MVGREIAITYLREGAAVTAGDDITGRAMPLPDFERPTGTRLSVAVAEALKQMIQSGEVRPGDRLPNEMDLCEHFGVSRITLREATQMLHALGLVEPTRGRGTFVRQPDPESLMRDLAYFAFADESSVQDLFEVRRLLESQAAARAAAEGSQDEREGLVTMVQDAQQLLESADDEGLTKVAQMDTHFHLRIAVMGGNLVLEQLMHRVMQILETVRFRSLTTPGQPERSWEQHLKIAEAIAKGNPQLAKARMVEHMETVKEVIIRNEAPG